MKIAIVGYGLEGKAAYDYWQDKGVVTICDLAAIEAPKGVETQTGDNYLANLNRFDIIVRSPVIKPQEIADANGGIEVLDKVTSNTNEFFKVSPTNNIIGITGTKGKGTTTTLITKMLEACGKRSFIGGNIGLPALELLKRDIKKDDWVVLELSSFQLVDFKYSSAIAVCLMVVPEHLDWHQTIEEYFKAKTQLFRHQTSDQLAIYFADNATSKQIASVGNAKKLPYFREPGAFIKDGSVHIAGTDICSTDELGLLGKHNWQNVCAAVTTVWQIVQDADAIKQVLINFKGLEHRLEFVREFNDVKYFNDSFAATPDAGTAAIATITGPKVMIMGGYERNLPLDNFVKSILDQSHEIRQLVLIGQSKNRVAEELNKIGYTNLMILNETSIDEIVKKASQLAQPGDSVVLSPGFPSFDMFKNFEERGLKYKAAVNAL